ncbi:hypothetical protein JCM11491_005434 [Sporobolomyces phaffii]
MFAYAGSERRASDWIRSDDRGDDRKKHKTTGTTTKKPKPNAPRGIVQEKQPRPSTPTASSPRARTAPKGSTTVRIPTGGKGKSKGKGKAIPAPRSSSSSSEEQVEVVDGRIVKKRKKSQQQKPQHRNATASPRRRQVIAPPSSDDDEASEHSVEEEQRTIPACGAKPRNKVPIGGDRFGGVGRATSHTKGPSTKGGARGQKNSATRADSDSEQEEDQLDSSSSSSSSSDSPPSVGSPRRAPGLKAKAVAVHWDDTGRRPSPVKALPVPSRETASAHPGPLPARLPLDPSQERSFARRRHSTSDSIPASPASSDTSLDLPTLPPEITSFNAASQATRREFLRQLRKRLESDARLYVKRRAKKARIEGKRDADEQETKATKVDGKRGQGHPGNADNPKKRIENGGEKGAKTSAGGGRGRVKLKFQVRPYGPAETSIDRAATSGGSERGEGYKPVAGPSWARLSSSSAACGSAAKWSCHACTFEVSHSTEPFPDGSTVTTNCKL